MQGMRSPIVTSLRNAALSSALLAASWALASPGTAVAQQVVVPPPPAVAPPPPPPPPAAPPPGYWFDMSSIGKPYGDILKGYGIYLNGGSETNVFGWLTGGRKTGVNTGGENTLGADLDLKTMFGIPGAAIHISTDERWGQNPARFAGSSVFNTANYGPNDGYRLGELSWDQDLFNDHVRILVGRIADNIDFASNDQGIYCQFLFSTCGQINAWYFNNANPSYPVANWGGRITLKPSLTTYIRAGAYQETTIEGAPNHLGWPGESWDFGHNKGVFIPVEIGYKTNFDQSPFPTGFDAGGYYDSSKFTPFLARPLETARGRSAVYIQGSQMVFRPDMSSHRGITAFAEVLWDTADRGPIADEQVAGITWLGPLLYRPADRFQFSAVHWDFNRSFAQSFQLATGIPMARSEWQLEIDYAYQLAPGVTLQPTVAYFINPDGNGLETTPPKRLKNAWVIGAQLAVGLNGAFGLPSFTRTN